MKLLLPDSYLLEQRLTKEKTNHIYGFIEGPPPKLTGNRDNKLSLLLTIDDFIDNNAELPKQVASATIDHILLICSTRDELAKLIAFKANNLAAINILLVCPLELSIIPQEIIDTLVSGVIFYLPTNDSRTAFSRDLLPALVHKINEFKNSNFTAGIAGDLELADICRLKALNIDILLWKSNDYPALIDIKQNLWPVFSADNLGNNNCRDKIFIKNYRHNFILGAYSYEKQITQQVSFDVTVEIPQQEYKANRQDNIFSYDIIIDAIHILTSHKDIIFIETLAQDLADYLLEIANILAVEIEIRKDDVINGSVGIKIRREN